LIDGAFASVGSTNLNHRSLMHDLEVDVELEGPESFRALESAYLEDLNHSIEIRDYDPGKDGWAMRLLRWLVGRLRYWA
jgi:cardiolipin synthase